MTTMSPWLRVKDITSFLFPFLTHVPMLTLFFGRKRIVADEPSDSVATVGLSSFSPSSWY